MCPQPRAPRGLMLGWTLTTEPRLLPGSYENRRPAPPAAGGRSFTHHTFLQMDQHPVCGKLQRPRGRGCGARRSSRHPAALCETPEAQPVGTVQPVRSKRQGQEEL